MYNLSTYSSINHIILKKLRGNRTQNEMSLLLDKKYNIYHRWESGEQRIKLYDFLKVCEVLEKNVLELLESSFNFKIKNKNFSNIFSDFNNNYSFKNVSDVIELLQISETSYWRLLNGKREIYFDEFLLLVNYKTQRVSIFLQELGISLDNKSIKKLNSSAEKYNLAYINYPELSIIGSYIYLKPIRKIKKLTDKVREISKLSKIEFLQVQKVLNELIENDVLFIDETNNYEFTYFVNTFSSKREKEVFHSLVSFLIKSLHKKMKNELTKKDVFSFRIAPVSNYASKKIKQIMLTASQDIALTIAKDNPEERTKTIGYLTSLVEL